MNDEETEERRRSFKKMQNESAEEANKRRFAVRSQFRTFIDKESDDKRTNTKTKSKTKAQL